MRAAVAGRHGDALVPPLGAGRVAGQRERRTEPAVVGPRGECDVRLVGNRHRNQAVVRRESVEPLVLHRAVIRDVAVDRVEVDVRRVDPVQGDAAVGRFRR